MKEFGGFAHAWLDSWTDPNDHDLYDIAPVGGDDAVYADVAKVVECVGAGHGEQ